MLTPPGDEPALAAGLGKLLADRRARVRMGAAGRAAYKARFGLETMVEKTAALYAEVLA